MEYSIWVKGQEVPVNEAVYHTYWKGVRKERYFTESDMHNHIFSYDALDDDGITGSEMFCDSNSLSVEELIIKHQETQSLLNAIKELDEKEQDLIQRIYFYNESLRHIAELKKIPHTTLQYRHQKILTKLKEYLSEDGGNDYE